jgi:FMN phosphatase YigB (HAD superfamily)
MNVNSGIATTLFDIGGVLTSDPWESLLLTPKKGIADRLQLERTLVQRVGRSLWKHYSTVIASEEEYWNHFSRVVGVTVPKALLAETEAQLLYANPSAKRMLDALAARGARIGIASDNTNFWYTKQVKLAGLHDYLDPSLLFLSFSLGVGKQREHQGLFEIASQSVDPGSTLVVDDRPGNIDKAHTYGFRTIHYSIEEDPQKVLMCLE